MTGFALLDVAIGVIFAFLTFSLIASTMQETLAAVFNWRGRMLRRGLFRLLETGANSNELLSKTIISDSIHKAELTLDLLNDPAMRSLQGSKSSLGRLWDWLADWWEKRRHKQKFETAETAYAALTLEDKPSFSAALTNAATTPAFVSKIEGALQDSTILNSVKAKGQGRMPANIPKETFAKSLLDTLYRKIEKQIAEKVADSKAQLDEHIKTAKADIITSLKNAEAAGSAAKAASLNNSDEAPKDDPLTLSDDVVREAKDLLQPSAAYALAYMMEVASATDDVIDGVSGIIEALPMNAEMKTRITHALKSIAVTRALEDQVMKIEDLAIGAAAEVTKQIKRLEAEVERVTAEIGDWFDHGMDRVSGWYVRRAKFVLFLLGFLMAMFSNFNIIGYGNQLLEDDHLRNRIVAQAEGAVADGNVAGLEVQRKTTEIFAALQVNQDRDGKITAEELEQNLDKLSLDRRVELGIDDATLKQLAKERGTDGKTKRQERLEAVAAVLNETFQGMVGAFAKDTDGKPGISDAERNAAAKAYIQNIQAEFGRSVDVLKTQFSDQGVKIGRTCPVPTHRLEPETQGESWWITQAMGSIADTIYLTDLWNWLKSIFWDESLAQCVKQSWSWQAFVSWLLIGFGCTFGGQFWFDILRNLLKVRTASAGLNSDLKKLMGSDDEPEKAEQQVTPARPTQ